MENSNITDWHRFTNLKIKIFEDLLALFAMPVSWVGHDSNFIAADIWALHDIYKKIKSDEINDKRISKSRLKKYAASSGAAQTSTTELDVDGNNGAPISFK
jgi:hypothetical protein